MKEYIRQFLMAILAGFAIAIGGTVYLTLDNKIIGALMFTVGLYIIVLNGLFLFTGKIGYMVNEKAPYIITLIVTWLGNLVGTGLAALIIMQTRINGISDTAQAASEAKLSQSPLSAFLLAIFCGILMFVAVDGFKETKNPLILFLCVSVFILCGFEHCIANMFYFSMGCAWSLKAVGYILLMTLGNSIGGMLIPVAKKIKANP